MARARQFARIVVIGNELLSGKVQDTNSPWLMRRLRRLGVGCRGLVVVPDTVDEIAAAVRSASSAADFVFTSGGVGPTHDDVTMAGVAAAFGVQLEEDPVIRAFLDERWRGPKSPARLRMALVPAGTEVLDTQSFPVVRFQNVYILPGVPRLFRGRFETIEHMFSGAPMSCSALVTTQGESELAPLLEQVVERFPEVEIGSYPRWQGARWEVLLTLEQSDQGQVAAALSELTSSLDPEQLVGVHEPYHPEDDEEF